jgi:hypothetical protein
MAEFKGTATRRTSSSTIIQYRISGCSGLSVIYVNLLTEGTNWGEYAPNTARLWVTPEDFVKIYDWGATFPMCLTHDGAEVQCFTCTSDGQSVELYPRPAAEVAAAAFG